jgi:hypothetical protein
VVCLSMEAFVGWGEADMFRESERLRCGLWLELVQGRR